MISSRRIQPHAARSVVVGAWVWCAATLGGLIAGGAALASLSALGVAQELQTAPAQPAAPAQPKALAPPKAPARPVTPAAPKSADSLAAGPSTDAPWTVAEDRWYELRLGGKPCGTNRETIEQRPGQVRSSAASELRLGRMGQNVVVRTRSRFTETADGKPLEVEIEKETGAAPVRTRWTFRADGVDVVDEQDGRTTTRRLPLPEGEWLTPGQAREFVRRRIAAGAEEFRLATVDPEAGITPVRIQSRRVGTSACTVGGKELRTTRWETTSSLLDRPSSEEFSADGVLVRTATDVGVGTLEARLSTREAVERSTGSVEVMARTFVPLGQDGAPLMRARTAALRLAVPGGRLLDLPSAGAQRFVRTTPDSGVVEIDMSNPQPAEPGAAADARYLASSVMVGSGDAAVQALAERALRGARAEPLARVAALRDAVARHLTRKDLASGFATASEAVRSRSGDCTEHAVLLAACLRSAGIPARVVSGLVYVDRANDMRHVFGWHMWTQALVDGVWVDVDAVLPPGGTLSHAGHLAVVVSAAEGASMDADLTRIVELIGVLTIRLESVNGAPVAPERAAPPRGPAGWEAPAHAPNGADAPARAPTGEGAR